MNINYLAPVIFMSAGLVELLPVQAADDLPRKNVLFICVDDFRTELGCYGSKRALTPNLDRFARSSTVFTRHYVQVPTSGASRCSMLTGAYPKNRKDVTNEAIAYRMTGKPETAQAESFVHLLRKNGYYTVGIGKIGHSADGYSYAYGASKSDVLEMPYSWNEFLFNPGQWKTGWDAFFGYVGGTSRIQKKGMVKPYECGEVGDEGYPDGLTAELAVEKLKELAESEKPFFLGVGFFKPHLPFNAPEKYWDYYDEQALPLTKYDYIPLNVNRASLHDSHEIKQYKLGDEDATLDRPVSEAYARKLVHAYLACVSYVDAQIGKVLDALEANGLAENTVVVIWGDHGWHLGEQRVWGKHTVFEVALNSAFMVRMPGVKGKISDRVVSSVDIYPTIADLCDVPLEGSMDGVSLRPLIEKKRNKQWQDLAYSYFNNGVSLRTSRYRLTKYYRKATPVVELYDYRKDPYETENIAEKHPDILTELMPLLEAGDTGLFQKK